MTDLVEGFDPITETQAAAARKIVCGNARGRSKKKKVEDAIDLMMMLGIHPDQDELNAGRTSLSKVHT